MRQLVLMVMVYRELIILIVIMDSLITLIAIIDSPIILIGIINNLITTVIDLITVAGVVKVITMAVDGGIIMEDDTQQYSLFS